MGLTLGKRLHGTQIEACNSSRLRFYRARLATGAFIGTRYAALHFLKNTVA
jgi:hypothetical protein